VNAQSLVTSTYSRQEVTSLNVHQGTGDHEDVHLGAIVALESRLSTGRKQINDARNEEDRKCALIYESCDTLRQMSLDNSLQIVSTLSVCMYFPYFNIHFRIDSNW